MFRQTMTTIIVTFLLMLVSLGATPAKANSSAGELLEFCTSTDDGSLVGCYLYIEGFMYGRGQAESWATIAVKGVTLPEFNAKWLKLICIPSNSNFDQMRRVFLKYSEDHPEHLHRPGQVVMELALNKAFPCDKELILDRTVVFNDD